VVALSIAALVGPLLLLVVAGAMLVRFQPSVASSVTLAGFAAHLVATIVANLIGMRMVRSIPDDSGGSMAVMQRLDSAATVASIGQVAFWVGALGLVWAIRKLARPDTPPGSDA
jgi:hypothetical protein